MKLPRLFARYTFWPVRIVCVLGLAALSSLTPVGANTATVVAAADTLLATLEAANPGATSTSTIPAVIMESYTLAICKQWTNLPGGTRNGPTIGGGPAALSTDLSATVPNGQTISPRAAAIALAEAPGRSSHCWGALAMLATWRLRGQIPAE